MSSRPFRTNAGAPVIASSMCCTLGRTRCCVRRRRRGVRVCRGAREVEQVRTLGLVELQRPGERLEHALGDAGRVAALEAGVVVDADAGEDRDLFAAQAGDAAPATAVRGQAGLLGRDPGSPGGQELADLVLGVHVTDGTPLSAGEGACQYLDQQGRSPGPVRASVVDALTLVSNPDMEDAMTDKKVWLITGAGRGMGVDIAKAALAAGNAVVATGRNPDVVTEAVGDADDLLAVKLDVTDPPTPRPPSRPRSNASVASTSSSTTPATSTPASSRS